MADQARWFKLWCSAPSDDDLLALPPELRWAWAVLGCYTKLHGTRGRVKLTQSNVVLAAQMGVSALNLRVTVALLPHVRIEGGLSDNGEFTVIWDNWTKYQEDSTVYERVKRLRAKKRREVTTKASSKLDTPNREIARALSSDEASSLEANKAKARALLKEVESRMKSP